MAEIILSFFSVIGLLFFAIYVCDRIFYRKFNKRMTLTVDINNLTTEDCFEIFELITSIRQMAIGRAAINYILVIVSKEEKEKIKIAEEYMRVFKIPGEIRKE